MASSLLNKLKLIAGESIDTTDPTDPDNPNQAIIDRYKNVPGVNVEKLTEYVNLNIPEPQTIVDAIILAEAIGYTPEQAKVVGAQWAVESGRGVSTAGADYNYFGVKSHNDAVMKRMSEQYGIDVSQGDVVKTVEYINGERKVIEDTFASFNNPIEGFLGKKAYLETNKRYKKALNPENTADEFAQGLKDAGYATDPVYASKLANIYNGPMRTTRPEWMAPTRKSNAPQKEWAMTGVQPTKGSRAELIEQKKSTSKNPIIAEYENFILTPEETKEWWYNIYKDDLESGKITKAELDKQIAIDKKEKNLEFQEYQKDPLAYIQDELDYALETREEGDDSYIASLEKVVNAMSPAPEKVEAPEKIDLQSAEEMQASINIDALQEWNNLQKQNWAGVKEYDPKGVEMLKEYNKKMGVNYDPSEAWSAITISNAVMAGSGANNRDEIRAKGFNPSKGHSYYISDAFKTSKNPDYKYNKYKAEKLSGTYNIGDILVKGRKPKEGIDTSKWSYEDFKSHGPGYSSHTDIIVDKGTDDKGEYIEIAGGNVGNTYATERIYVKDIPSRKYKATLRDKATIKPSFTINKNEPVLNPFTGEKKAENDAILADIKYNPRMPRMIGNTEEDVTNYLVNKKNVEDVALAQLAAEEEKNYQSSTDNYERFAAANAANEQILPEVRVVAKKPENKEDEIIPLQKPVEEEKVIDMEYLNNIPDVNSFISPGSFTNESRSKEELKQATDTKNFIMSPLKKNANSGYFGSGQSLFYPSTRQQKYGGAMAPIIPTWNYPSEKTFVRDTTALPFKTGGSISIKPENKGKFTAKANAAGMGVQTFANKVLGASKGTYSPSTRKQANFARNASKWNRSGGTIYPKYFENGGPSDGNPFWHNVLNNVENIVEDHYQSMSPTEYAKLSADTTNKLQQYQDEKIRVGNVMDKAHQLGLKLATNAPGEKKEKRGKGYVLNYDSDPYIPTLEPRNVTIGNTQDWEAIGMDFINDPQNYLNNLKDIDTYTGEIEYLTGDGENFILDSEGNKVPSYYQGYGCIGAQCGIYSTAGATNISDYKTGYGNQVAKAGDPIFKQLSNKFWDADNQAALKAAGFEKTDNPRVGSLARVHDDYYTTKNPSYGHSAMVNKVNADGTQVDFDAKDGFIENPGGLAEGIITSSPYNSYKGRLDYYNYVGNEPQLKKEYETLLEQQKAYKKYNQPVEIPIKKAKLTKEEPVKMPFIEKKQYPNTRRGRKQEQQDNAYITAYMNRIQKK